MSRKKLGRAGPPAPRIPSAPEIPVELLLSTLHDLASPLVALKLGVRALGRPAATPERRAELAAQLDTLIERMTSLARELIHAVATGQSDGPVRREDVDLSALAHEVAAAFSGELAQGSDVAVVAPEPVVGSWDSGKLWQILQNLVANALQHGDHTPVRISVWSEGELGCCAVKSGAPMRAPHKNPNNLEHHGLGLWIVRRLTASLGGEIAVNTGNDIGTEVLVRLPR